MRSLIGAPKRWYHRHLKLVEGVCFLGLFTSLTLMLISVVGVIIAVVGQVGFPRILAPLSMLAASIAALIVSVILGPHTMEIIDKQKQRPVSAAPTPTPQKSFVRPYPAWGEPGAQDDFETYLRTQFTPALVLMTNPDTTAIYRLTDYLIELFSDRFPRHDVLTEVSLPRGWAIEGNAWEKEGDCFVPYSASSWMKLRAVEADIFEIAYQTFRTDPTILRFPVAPAEPEVGA